MLFTKMMDMNEEINELYLKDNTGYSIALVGNPNVGKSTVFNALTGMRQHTGNWPGKTVSLASGKYIHNNQINEMIDLPGTYSLLAHSSEEEVTRNFICFEDCDVCVVVCDSTCLERNLNLVLQTLEITNKVVVCLNLCDEAKKKNIEINTQVLMERLGVEVVSMSARNNIGFEELKEAVHRCGQKKRDFTHVLVRYDAELETSIQAISDSIQVKQLNTRFLAIKLLEGSESEAFYQRIENPQEVKKAVQKEQQRLEELAILPHLEDRIVHALGAVASAISEECITFNNTQYFERDLKIDRIVTHKVWGILLMIALLGVIFWITISGANVPSAMLSDFFGMLEGKMNLLFVQLGMNETLRSILMDGVYKTLAWVISVMLPPMAIFFPLFTILEDFGYLPRIAFNLDGFFHKAKACGKQALTMSMGFGCNAVGVSGCRIIDSPRERLLAILTNNFVPCNGRFPTLIAIITMFFAGAVAAPWNGLVSTFLLTAVILLGVILTFWISRLLSLTLLKGVPSSFTLELPPYRKPQFGKVIVRSIFDRTLFVLGRAISVAIPAGFLIWIMANVQVDGLSLLTHVSSFLDPFAKLIGLDGVILLAFLLGFPANEIVVPIMIMAYMSSSYMMDMDNLFALKELLVANGWTWVTAVCTMLFSLIHFPCATTMLTIKKETGSWKWTALAFLIPTITGILVCFLVAQGARLFL